MNTSWNSTLVKHRPHSHGLWGWPVTGNRTANIVRLRNRDGAAANATKESEPVVTYAPAAQEVKVSEDGEGEKLCEKWTPTAGHTWGPCHNDTSTEKHDFREKLDRMKVAAGLGLFLSDVWGDVDRCEAADGKFGDIESSAFEFVSSFCFKDATNDGVGVSDDAVSGCSSSECGAASAGIFASSALEGSPTESDHKRDGFSTGIVSSGEV
ncbi:hypothetical protein GQ43DRAFT_433948 [Delitschia confertaspora ATCC 74209]|uniref:Uncharacterized protein n=1 Tax=Delitschia confertaspora ATCC 74209 TaxID=1513339 RepID=A0A9P4JG72_9PLEO|nr:hypothetical protein GQ43DRAFT_433948 [Delitschia confertaspora ATCC 74209]